MDLEGLTESGAVDPGRIAALLSKKGPGVQYGTLIKDPRKAQQFISKAAKSKSKSAQFSAAMMSALMRHEAIVRSDAQKSPTVTVNVFFSAVTSGGSSATATLRTPYPGRDWALRSMETIYIPASGSILTDPGLFIQFNPGGVDLALSPTTQSVTYSSGSPQAGIPSQTFNTLATVRDSTDIVFRPWTRHNRVFDKTDYFYEQMYNAGPVTGSWFVLHKLISSPCAGQGFKMKKKGLSWFRLTQNLLHQR